ncbi:MAG: hypothetical protein DRN96_08295 [Thermoproteota archaeon]|nr:MAG: hypothetical protein DRN96_08295 [Candidatus Korarchaeota archaeon]
MASSTVVAAAEDMLSPFYPVYFKERFNLSMSAVSLLFTLSGGIWNVMSIPSGWLADKLGRKRVILASWLSSVAEPLALIWVYSYRQLVALVALCSLLASIQVLPALLS